MRKTDKPVRKRLKDLIEPWCVLHEVPGCGTEEGGVAVCGVEIWCFEAVVGTGEGVLHYDVWGGVSEGLEEGRLGIGLPFVYAA